MYVDENFGVWHDMEDEDVINFYHRVQKESKSIQCRTCKYVVKLLPQYDLCNSCAELGEKGYW